MMKRTGKTIAAVGLSLSIFMSGGLVLNPITAHAATAASATSLANKIISTGKDYMGVPYRYGSKTGNTSSFDCSSFTQTVYRMNGVSIPRSSRQQSKAGTYVSRSKLRPGDLVFFYSPIHHVAIYIGNGKILHTYGEPGVTISSLNSGWWDKHYATARRVLPQGGQAVTSSSTENTAQIIRGVSFRTGPSLRNSRIRYLKRGETVTILDKVNSYWYKVKDQHGKVGYVTTMSKYIRK